MHGPPHMNQLSLCFYLVHTNQCHWGRYVLSSLILGCFLPPLFCSYVRVCCEVSFFTLQGLQLTL